jgi:2-dehydropantoate 2-reductase
MRIAIYGTGGVGGYFGGRLAQAGEDTTFIARGEHLAAIQSGGLRIESLKGNAHIYPVQATDNPASVGEVDIVLLGVKAWQVPEVAIAIHPMVGAKTIVIPLQNGVEAPAQLIAELGEEHVLGGLCQISAFIAEPGLIRHVGVEPYIAFARLDGKPSQPADHLRQAFLKVGVKVEIPQDIQAAMWEKFVFIVAISGVGAVSRQPAGIIRSLPETRRMLEGVMQEIVSVAAAKGILLPEDAIMRKMAFIDHMPAEAVASMQRDLCQLVTPGACSKRPRLTCWQ